MSEVCPGRWGDVEVSILSARLAKKNNRKIITIARMFTSKWPFIRRSRRGCFIVKELKHARFWDADGNRKRTFRVPGQWCSQIVILIISDGEKVLSNVNVVVWSQVVRKNSSLPFAARVLKSRLLKLLIIKRSRKWRIRESAVFVLPRQSSDTGLKREQRKNIVGTRRTWCCLGEQGNIQMFMSMVDEGGKLTH